MMDRMTTVSRDVIPALISLAVADLGLESLPEKMRL